jgi:molybdenum cofactor cytidylyltransferase
LSGVHALVLAAGAGRRFGGRKLTSPWRDGLLIDGALAAALAAPVRKVWVVAGADPGVASVVARSPDAGRMQVVEAVAFDEGLSASLKAGLAALPGEADGVLVFLGDMPNLPRQVLAPLVAAIVAGAPAAAPFFEGRRGHPVAIGRALFPLLHRLEGDRGAGAILDRLGAALVRVPTDDPGVLYDVDYAQAPP